jgi:hypothetical protein
MAVHRASTPRSPNPPPTRGSPPHTTRSEVPSTPSVSRPGPVSTRQPLTVTTVSARALPTGGGTGLVPVISPEELRVRCSNQGSTVYRAVSRRHLCRACSAPLDLIVEASGSGHLPAPSSSRTMSVRRARDLTDNAPKGALRSTQTGESIRVDGPPMSCSASPSRYALKLHARHNSSSFASSRHVRLRRALR